MKNLIVTMTVSVALVGCASGGSKKTDDGKTIGAAPAPTYTEKVSSVNLQEYRGGTCPTETKFDGQDWRRLVGAANACVKANSWHKVELIGTHLAKHAHLTPWGAYFMSLAAQSRKDYPRATWMLELALKKAPNEGLFHYQMGRLHWDLGEDAAAIKEMKLASDLSANLVDAHYVVGHLALQKGDDSEAEKRLRKALAVDPKHWGSTMAMASLRIKNKDWTKAESQLEAAIAMNPRSMKARVTLAQIREQQLKKFQEALDDYKELRALTAQKKLDEPVGFSLDEKIQTLEKSLNTVAKENKVVRKPTADGKVAQ